MLRADEMPDDIADLAKIDLSFPYLSPDNALSCPVSMAEVLDYLAMESPGGDDISTTQLTFLRTALIAERKYWIWHFHERDGSECYVTVSVDPGGSSCVGYEENYYSLNPEQFMLGDFYEVF